MFNCRLSVQVPGSLYAPGCAHGRNRPNRPALLGFVEETSSEDEINGLGRVSGADEVEERDQGGTGTLRWQSSFKEGTMSFLWPLWSSTTDSAAENSTYLFTSWPFSWGGGGDGGLADPSERHCGGLFLASSSPGAASSLPAQSLLSNTSLCHSLLSHLILFRVRNLPLRPLKRTPAMVFRVHLDNPVSPSPVP